LFNNAGSRRPPAHAGHDRANRADDRGVSSTPDLHCRRARPFDGRLVAQHLAFAARSWVVAFFLSALRRRGGVGVGELAAGNESPLLNNTSTGRDVAAGLFSPSEASQAASRLASADDGPSGPRRGRLPGYGAGEAEAIASSARRRTRPYARRKGCISRAGRTEQRHDRPTINSPAQQQRPNAQFDPLPDANRAIRNIRGCSSHTPGCSSTCSHHQQTGTALSHDQIPDVAPSIHHRRRPVHVRPLDHHRAATTDALPCVRPVPPVHYVPLDDAFPACSAPTVHQLLPLQKGDAPTLRHRASTTGETFWPRS